MTPATLTAADFILAFPEFDRCEAAKVAAAVAAANRRVDADVFDTGTSGVANDAAGYLAAARLAGSKFGQSAKLDPKPYLDAYQAIAGGNLAGPLLPDLEET